VVSPWGLSVDGDDLWIADHGSPSVVRLNRQSGDAQRFALPEGTELPFDVVAAGGSVWVSSEASATVTRLDPSTGEAENLAFGGVPYQITFDGTDVWTNGAGNVLVRIDPATGAGTEFDMGTGASKSRGVDFDGRYVWSANPGSRSVTRIDPASGESTVFELPPTARTPLQTAFDGASLWTVNLDSNNLTRLTP